MIVNNTNDFKTNFLKYIQENKTLISIITVLYLLPLYTTNNFSPLRSLLNQITILLIFGIFTLSFELQLGRTGLLNFGQAVFFGVGAYGLAFYLDYIASLSTNSGFLPQFVVAILQNSFMSLIVAFIIGILFGAVLGFLMGLTTNRMRGITFAFIALAIAMLFYSYFSQTPQGSALSGGETGKRVVPLDLFQTLPLYVLFAVIITPIILILFITVIYTDVKERRGIFGISLFDSPLGDAGAETKSFTKQAKNNRKIIKGIIFVIPLLFIAYFIIFIGLPDILGMIGITNDTYFFTIPIAYYFVLSCAVLMYLFSKQLVHSPFGRVLAGISQNEERVQALGYNVYWYKIKALTVSGAMGGLAGALYASATMLISPETTFSVTNTVNVMIYSIVGGLNTLFGPFLGAAFVISSEAPHNTSLGALSTLLQQYNISTDMILIIVGIIYIMIVMFLPYGMSGTFQVKMTKINQILRKIRISPSDYWILAFFSLVFILMFLMNFSQILNLLPTLMVLIYVIVFMD